MKNIYMAAVSGSRQKFTTTSNWKYFPNFVRYIQVYYKLIPAGAKRLPAAHALIKTFDYCAFTHINARIVIISVWGSKPERFYSL